MIFAIQWRNFVVSMVVAILNRKGYQIRGGKCLEAHTIHLMA